MLTREHGIAAYDYARGQIIPDRLTSLQHAHYLEFAERMLKVYQEGTGRTRGDLHRAIRQVFEREPECPQRRIDAFCKLLDDASTYRKQGETKAPELRRQVFRLAAQQHPLVQRPDRLFNSSEALVKADIARQLGREWHEIDEELFADVMEFNRLESFAGYESPRQLLSQYNVAQVQVSLYSAISLDVRAGRDFETILRYARLSKLMHSISRLDDTQYLIRFDGPASVLRTTRRYGIAMAKFLPALLACSDWQLHAVIETPRRAYKLSLRISSQDGFVSRLPAPEDFDSEIESRFAAKWGTEPRDGWVMIREGAILSVGQKTFVPDFLFQHADGRRVLMEIVGFWTPEYIEARRQTLALFPHEHLLIAVGASADRASAEFQAADERIIHFKTALKLEDVLQRLNSVPNSTEVVQKPASD